MSNPTKDYLFSLIKSLSKSEKRQFKLYVHRLGGNADAKYIALFDLIDKMPVYKEDLLMAHQLIKKEQLSNLKSHLYKQILISLRLNPGNKNIELQLRELLDFSMILYGKGLYHQSLKILERANDLANEHEDISQKSHIVEFEKVINSQYVNNATAERIEALTKTSFELMRQNERISMLSSLSLRIYRLMLKTGYVKNDKEALQIRSFFESIVSSVPSEELSFLEKLWYCKAQLWYYMLVQDFPMAYKHANKLVELFYDRPQRILNHPTFFMKAHNYLFEILYLLRYRSQFESDLRRFEKILLSKDFPANDNIACLSFVYIYSARLNLHFLKGEFKQAEPLAEEILAGINRYQNMLGEYQVMLFYYKIACLYFGTSDNKKCISYLNKIIDSKLAIREDLMCFSRLLLVIVYYEENLEYHLERSLKSLYKFLLQIDELYVVQKELIRFFKSLGKIYPQDLKKHFKKLLERILPLENDRYEKRAFLYLDIVSWLQSKIENRPIADIIKEKSKTLCR